MTVHEEYVDVGATKVRGLLGVLSYKCNEPVSVGYLADALWDDEDGPPDPTKTLQTYVSRLRRALNESRFPAKVNNDHGAYRLVVDSSIVDFYRFTTMVRTGHRAFGVGEYTEAVDAFAMAIDLWRGPPLANLKTSWARRLQSSLAVRELLPAHCALFDAMLALGAHELVLDRLPPLLSDHPHDDRLAGLWMRALAEANRSSEVASFYRDFCQRLKVDMDAVPGPAVVEIYQKASNATDKNNPQKTVRVPPPPRDTPYFTGRAELLTRLDALLIDPDRTTSVVALDGRPGVGKTNLIRRWAHHRQDQFPDGMLHMDLGGYASTNPVEPGTVMGMFLDELGVPAERIHTLGMDDRAALLRHTLAGRRILVILDNVRDSSHVRPILAATANCPVVITSRQRLTSIVVRDGAEHVTVPELSDDEAIELLMLRIGQRAVDEPEAVGELVTLCDRLPLAVRIASEHVAARPQAPVHELVDELRQTRRLLDAGSHGDDDSATLRATFSWSYRALRPAQQRLFRLLGLLPGARFGVDAAAAVSGLDRAEIDSLLDALVGAHLVEQERAGRFRTHDLVHLYAGDNARRDEPAEDRDQAELRLIDWYVESARDARGFLTADPHDVPALPSTEPVEPLSFGSPEDAKRWFDLERANLVALTRRATDLSHHEAVWRLAACLNVVNDHDLHELLDVHQLGHVSAGLAGQPSAEAGCLTSMGVIYTKLSDNLRAGRCFEQAHDAFRKAGDAHGEAVTLHNIGSIRLKLGDPVEAIKWHRQALAAFSAAHDEWAIANVHRWLGDDFRRLGQFDEANGHYLDAQYRSQKLGDILGQGATMNRLAQLHLDIDRPDLAINSGQAALDIHDRTGDRGSAAEVLCTLATARIRLKTHAEAISNATEAVRVHQKMRNAAGQAAALEVLGHAYVAAGKPGEARRSWSAAADLLDALSDSRADELRALVETRIHQDVPAPRRDSTSSVRSYVTAPKQTMSIAGSAIVGTPIQEDG